MRSMSICTQVDGESDQGSEIVRQRDRGRETEAGRQRTDAGRQSDRGREAENRVAFG